MRISDWSSDVCSSDLSIVNMLRQPIKTKRRSTMRLTKRLGLLAAAAAFTASTAAVAAPTFINILTGGTSGVYYPIGVALRSEEHTSELQSLMRISYAVFCLKKKNKTKL